jgi:transaldolase
MKLLLASADLALIQRLAAPGIFAGVITNPDLVAASGKSSLAFGHDLVQVSAGMVFLQVRAKDADRMVAEAEHLVALAPDRLVVKVPATEAGLNAMATLVRRGVVVAATCLPTVALAVIAEAVGVRFIIPWASMLEKRGAGDRESTIAEMQECLERQRSAAELVVGAYKPVDMVRLARTGVRNVFIWDRDLASFVQQPLASEAAESFSTAWSRIDHDSY